jgi:hypothetical protein
MIESLKSQMLELLQNLEGLDTKQTPFYVFAEHYEATLTKELDGYVPDPKITAREILAKSEINLSGLGVSAEGHEDFLKDFAEGTARVLIKMYRTLYTRFGHNVALNAVTGQPIKFA